PIGPFLLVETSRGSRFTHTGGLLAGGWHELSARASGAETALFVDGVRYASPPSNATFSAGSGRIHIGRGFVGVLDDVAIYPSVLSDGFILRHAVDGYPVGIRGVV